MRIITAFLLGLMLACNSAPAQRRLANTWDIGPFRRPLPSEPVIVPNPKSVFLGPIQKEIVHWEALHTFNPAAIVRDGKINVLYRAEDNTGAMEIGGHTSRLGLAVSTDGIHFTRNPAPVFFPARDAQMHREWPGGTEDPRIVEAPDGMYVLTYTQWNGKIWRVGIATSLDFIHWKKYGPAFAHASEGKYFHLRYKSAGIVTRLAGGRLIAAKIHGKYWMYWGEGEIRLATSSDLIHWTPVEDAHGNPVVVLSRRPGHFDSAFPEVGPPPLLTKNGILVIYNGKNAEKDGDPSLKPGTYSDGQALFSTDDPTKLLARTDQPFFQPEMPFERSGQYAAGTTFAEGLVFYQGKWLLYYGCADSRVGVAISTDRNPELDAAREPSMP